MPITGFADDNTNHWDHDTGLPTSSLFGNAIQVWSIAQERSTTIAEAALVFNVAPDLIKLAVEDHPWMFLGKDGLIEHDGE